MIVLRNLTHTNDSAYYKHHKNVYKIIRSKDDQHP